MHCAGATQSAQVKKNSWWNPKPKQTIALVVEHVQKKTIPTHKYIAINQTNDNAHIHELDTIQICAAMQQRQIEENQCPERKICYLKRQRAAANKTIVKLKKT